MPSSSIAERARRGPRAAAVLALLLLACVAGLPEIRDDDVARAQVSFPETTRARLEEGRRTFSLRCGVCHQAYDPRQRSADEWRQRVAEMSPRAGLDGDRRQLVLEYLLTFAR